MQKKRDIDDILKNCNIDDLHNHIVELFERKKISKQRKIDENEPVL